MTNNNLSCIPFYTSLAEQDFRKWYAYGDKFPFYVPSDYLIPFSFSIPKAENSDWDTFKIEFVKVCCTEESFNGNGAFSSASFNASFRTNSASFVNILTSNGLTYITSNADFDIVSYPARKVSSLGLPKGMYYMAITPIDEDGEEYDTYYSDVFFVDSRAVLESTMTKIQWSYDGNVVFDEGMLIGTSASASYIYELYIDTDIAKPTYNFTEEGDERNGRFFPTKQISDKSFNMQFYAPEYLCDVMRVIRMADSVTITDKLARAYSVEQFEMEVDWLEQGHYAQVDCTFKTDTVVKKVGKTF